MLDAREANQVTQQTIKNRITAALLIVEKTINAAIGKGLFSTIVIGPEFVEQSVREDVVKTLKNLGYQASYISGDTTDCYQVKVSWEE